MEYGAIDLHKKESQVRIITEGGEVIDCRIATTRDRASSIDMPCLTRPIAEGMNLALYAGAGNGAARQPVGVQTSTSVSRVTEGCRNAAGITPMISRGRPSTMMPRPITPVSPPNRRCQ